MTWVARSARESEVRVFKQFVQSEGWNGGEEGNSYNDVIDIEGLLVGELDGKIVSTLGCVKFGSYAWLGLYICHPDYRGKGFGFKLWQHGMEYLNNCSVLGLDANLDQESNYQRSGFVSDFTLLRYQVTLENIFKLSVDQQPGSETRQILSNETNFINLCIEMDSKIYPEIDRRDYMRKWLNLPCNRVVGYMKDSLLGFGVVRSSDVGVRIGPFQARDIQTAKSILQQIGHVIKEQNLCQDGFVHFDFPDTSQHALDLVTELQGVLKTTCRRMYKGKPPTRNSSCEFGTANIELTF